MKIFFVLLMSLALTSMDHAVAAHGRGHAAGKHAKKGKKKHHRSGKGRHHKGGNHQGGQHPGEDHAQPQTQPQTNAPAGTESAAPAAGSETSAQ